jgi:hypothetical protein
VSNTKHGKGITVALVILVVLARSHPTSAQQLSGFVTFGVSSDSSQQFPGVGGGVLLDLANSWMSIGGQGDMFFSGGYVAGRGGPLGQANLIRHGALRVFAIGGFGFGVMEGPMFGGGVEVRPANRRIGFRATVQDYVQRSAATTLLPRRTAHQPSIQFGMVWR